MNARMLVLIAACMGMSLAHAAPPDGLRAKYEELRPKLSDNHFQKPLYLESSESPNGAIAGDVYAVIDQPFATAAPALSAANGWCDILLLPANTKYCRASAGGQGSVLNVRIGRKADSPVEQAYKVDFAHKVIDQTDNHLQVQLSAEQGPLGTRNYRIVLEAIPLEQNRTFIHLSYSYSVGSMGRFAMQMYLGSAGKDKVGFTVVGGQGGQQALVGGMRGVIERNSMRYYLGIEAYLGALSAPPEARLEKRLTDWFQATERYPRQLHEMDQAAYLGMKRQDYQRQQAGPLAAESGRSSQ